MAPPMFDDSHITPYNVGKLVILVLSVSLHESAHAYTADRLGDPTARQLGRVTLNPLAHLDLVMSVLLPALLIFSNAPFIFGAGKPVPVQRYHLRNPARDFALIAVAGPLSNVVLSLMFTGLMVVSIQTGLMEAASTSHLWLVFGVWINLVLAFFNMIPVPPLDGSRLLAYVLPASIRPSFYALDRIGFLLLLVLIFTNVLQRVMAVTFEPVYAWWYHAYHQWL